ncbi:hypothetical protein H3H37_05200 [Duganella sp. LX20W]|uniref:Uncharacterized protein n=1 Tax=Rugamonas brunnea TaxID=2758569 RepID=A0A7W2IAH6_9BURK|nr:hypothetical protein [Rugamonas brunnea]MBA5636446.1 hypothetical protein [Rugamonas brunnea]
MTKLIVKVETVEEFFERGRKIAQLADQQLPIPPSHVVSFEDPDDMLKWLATLSPRPALAD